MDDIFGRGTAETKDFEVLRAWFWLPLVNPSPADEVRQFDEGLRQTESKIQAAIKRIEEKVEDANEHRSNAVLRAYDGLELHPEISRACSDLYRNGHYSNAIEDAMKALMAYVRLRSGVESDGVSLMQHVFSANHPVLQFNNLSGQSEINEQKGFMSLFVGAVEGLRNPRAHTLIKDDPERALEFIAFVSLLAKLVDDATKIRQA
jgi:uncharacterized protein (TIGR02391 family)